MERVNNIFKKIDKKITISVGVLFLIVSVAAGLMKITLNVMYPGNDLAVLIKESISDTFGKAVKFESYFFRFNGDIVLLNFYLSNSSDFNDNLNLIKCEKIIIDTDILSLFQKEISISGVNIYDPEINIIKNYGKKYFDIITDNFLSGLNRERFESLAGDGFVIKIHDGRGFYREVFRNGKNIIGFEDFDVWLKYKNKEIRYRAEGNILKRKKSIFNNCSFSIRGEVNTADLSSESRLRINDFDIIQLEELIKDNDILDYEIKGDLSADVKISHNDKFTRFNGKSSIDRLECIDKSNDKPSYLCKGDDIDAEYNFYFSDDYSRINVEKIRLEDGIFSIDAIMEYEKGAMFSSKISSNKIDLEDLSEYFSPFTGCKYSGNLQFIGRFLYRIDAKMPEDIAIECNLDKFNLNSSTNRDPSLMIVKNCSSSFKLTKDRMMILADFITGKSDFKISVDTAISNWSPFVSNTVFRSSSDNLDLRLLKNGIFSFIRFVYDEAFIDMFQNFDEQRNFLKEPEGIFIGSNNISADLSASSVFIAGNSRLSNFNISLGLNNGTLKTKNFTVNGYAGAYNFDLYAAFRQEYPFIKLTGTLTGFDLGAVSADSGLPWIFSGILACDFKFETNAYRIGQVIENGNASVALSITSGSLNRNLQMQKVYEHITSNGFMCDPFDTLNFDSLTLDFVQSGAEFYIKKFNVSGPGLNLSGYGRYFSEEEELKLPLNLQVKNGEEYVRVPLMMYGRLLAPCVKVNEKVSNGEVCF